MSNGEVITVLKGLITRPTVDGGPGARVNKFIFWGQHQKTIVLPNNWETMPRQIEESSFLTTE